MPTESWTKNVTFGSSSFSNSSAKIAQKSPSSLLVGYSWATRIGIELALIWRNLIAFLSPMFVINIYSSVDIMGSNGYLLSGEMILIWNATYKLYIDRKVKESEICNSQEIGFHKWKAFGTKLSITSSYLTAKLFISTIIFPELRYNMKHSPLGNFEKIRPGSILRETNRQNKEFLYSSKKV